MDAVAGLTTHALQTDSCPATAVSLVDCLWAPGYSPLPAASLLAAGLHAGGRLVGEMVGRSVSWLVGWL